MADIQPHGHGGASRHSRFFLQWIYFSTIKFADMSGREMKPLRQHSLDCGIKIPLRRQISEDIISKTAIQAGRQLKIAWTVEKIEPESEQVEIVAKKCGQPKPKPAVKPPRSPFAPDQNTVLFSRQQLTERLRSSWQKNSSSRHNLDIFLNRSVESENSDTGGSLPRTPDDTESSENEDEISRCIPPNGGSPVPAQSTPLPPPQITYQSDQANNDTPKLCASARRMNFRNMGRQRSILESPCPTPEPGKATPTFKNINRQRVGDSSSSCASTPEPRKQLTRMMSAPPRSLPPSSRKLVKAPSMETPILSPNQRVKSAPPKRKLRSAKKRTNGKLGGQDTSDDDGEGNAKGQGGKRGARRGVDRGEVVTMVSLVSPAGTDSDEPTCIALPFPTPKQSASSTPVPKEELKPTPPPPIICLRKPLKSVTFRPSIAGSPPTVSQYHTNFALRKSAVLTHQSSLPVESTVASTGGHYKVQTKLNQSSRQTLQRTATHQQSSSTNNKPHSTVIRKRVGLQDHGKFQHPIKEVADKDVVPIISNRSNSVESTITITPTTTTTVVTTVAGNSQRCNINNVAITTTVPCCTSLISPSTTTTTTTVASITSNDTEESDPSKPNFKSSKEKECWDLFKKMSDRGVSISFETVLRGLLTPTEYRMRKAALLSVC